MEGTAGLMNVGRVIIGLVLVQELQQELVQHKVIQMLQMLQVVL
jgi:hypothetical protein